MEIHILMLNLMISIQEEKTYNFCRYVNDVSRYGKLIVNENKIEKFVEKNSNGPGIINGGVYMLPKKIFEIIHYIQIFQLNLSFQKI